MSDWHVGPALWRRRFPLLLYAMYACMALGYGALGLAYLGALPGTGAGWHLLGAGAVGLGVFVVIAIAGRAHAGLLPDPGPWVPLGGALMPGRHGAARGGGRAGLGRHRPGRRGGAVVAGLWRAAVARGAGPVAPAHGWARRLRRPRAVARAKGRAGLPRCCTAATKPGAARRCGTFLAFDLG
ncbi:NnrS family protein [Alicycliphilus sp. B1]|nr:NnrS family protein [Alicycliphilus sp. B1]